MSNDGYIKLYRQSLDNPIICKDSDHFAIWGYLLLSATHKEQKALFNGKQITLLPGQLITGRKSIAEKFNISESKVQRVLKTFEIEQQIEQQTGNKNRLVSLLNWGSYQYTEQQNEHQLNINRTSTEHQLNTNKNDKKEKNEKNEEKENKKKKKPAMSENALRLATVFLSEVKKIKTDIREPNMDAWSSVIDAMIRIDHRTPDRIEQIIRSLSSMDFWSRVCLSPGSLRKHYDRIDLQLETPRTQSNANNMDVLRKYVADEERAANISKMHSGSTGDNRELLSHIEGSDHPGKNIEVEAIIVRH